MISNHPKANSQARCKNFHPITINYLKALPASLQLRVGFCDEWKLKRLKRKNCSLILFWHCKSQRKIKNSLKNSKTHLLHSRPVLHPFSYRENGEDRTWVVTKVIRAPLKLDESRYKIGGHKCVLLLAVSELKNQTMRNMINIIQSFMHAFNLIDLTSLNEIRSSAY